MSRFLGAAFCLAAPFLAGAKPEILLFPHQQSKSVEIRSVSGELFTIQGRTGRLRASQVSCRTSQDAISCSNRNDLVLGLTLQIETTGTLLFTFPRTKPEEVARGRLELRWRPVYIAVLRSALGNVQNVPDRLQSGRD